jgi:structural maintenance of chromosome 1
MGRLVQLVVRDFKSYRGVQTIGPFHDFTAVIGPNGSGKSNLMDAISFVLGVKSAHLRSRELRELVHRPGEGSVQPESCYVAAEYHSNDQVIIFKRSVTPNGSSEYKLNDKVVSYQQYIAAVESEGILVSSRNFLVFQGDIEAVASQSPKDLTRLIELISGSLELKEEYDMLKSQQEKASEASAMNFSKKRSMNAELKQLKEQKEETARFKKLSSQKVL